MRKVLLVLALSALARNDAGGAPPTTRGTSTASTRPAFRPVELHYSIYLARYDLRITVSPDGLLRGVRTENKTYGPNDLDPNAQRVEIREGKLTPGQITALAHLLAGWDSLSSKPCPGDADDADVSLRYGDKTVSGAGHALPTQATDARVRLMELARAMPVVTR